MEAVHEEIDDVELFFGNTGVASPSEDMVKKMETFVNAHSDKLIEMEDALTEALSQVWDPLTDTMATNLKPQQKNENVITLIKDRTNNELFNKVVTVFSYLCAEVHDLSETAEEKFYGPLTMYAHTTDDEDDIESRKKQEGPEIQMGKFLSFLQDMCNFVRRIRRVTTNMIHQIACLYHERQKLYLSTFKHIHLQFVFESLGKLLRILVTLDALIRDNKAVSHGWQQYKKMLKYIRAEPDRFGLDSEKLRTFESLMVELDRQVISARMYEACISQDFGLANQTNAKGLVAGNRVMFEEFTHHVKAIEKRFTAEIENDRETVPRDKFVDLYALYALYRRLFHLSAKPDKKLFKRLWSLQKKVPLVLLSGRAVWFPANFLRNHAPLQVKSLTPNPNDVIQKRKEFVDKQDDTFVKETKKLYLQVCAWMVRIDSDLEVVDKNTGSVRTVTAIVNERSKLLLNGLLLANQIQNLLSVNVLLHLETEAPFRQVNIRSLSICSELLKAIQFTYHRKSVLIAQNISNMVNLAQFTLKRIFHPIMKKLESHPRLDDQKLDVLAGMNLTLEMLKGTPTVSRMIVLQLTTQISQLKNTLNRPQMDEVRYQMWTLELLSDWQRIIHRSASCSFLYWAIDLIPAFFKDIFDNSDQVHRLPYLFAALRDPARMLVSVRHQDDQNEFLHSYRDELEKIFEEEIISPLARAIETDLRLHIHSVVLRQENLRNKTVNNLSRFVKLKPLTLFNKRISLKKRIEHYLDTTFYNMSTVALHDWKIYAEMRNLAHEKYGLTLTEVHLPSHSHYSEGLDVLEIMRHIHIFVARYSYNLNTQCFIERSFDQKHLNTINIQHIANSIRTHGTGIMNTTVNFTYQFLIQKFLIFSEFLYDDHIKSRLMKDVRWFKEEKDNLDNRFSYQRAEKFTRKIRALGVTSTGLSYLDQFRRLITEIGNALGYVRMVRSGGLSHCSKGIKFVPDLENINSFEEYVTVSSLSDETKEASKNMDSVIDNLSRNFAEGTDYFKILVSVFVEVLKQHDDGHLKFFYAIVPPLTISFVEKMLAQKDRLTKKGKAEASFTDDGFALGLAFILKVMDQNNEFDSLHWWEGVSYKLTLVKDDLKKQQEAQKNRSDEFQTLQLSIKRTEILKTEWDLLFFSFRGARIFFREADPEPQEDDEEDKKEEGAEGTEVKENGDAAPAPAGAPPAPPPAAGGAPPAAPPPAPSAAFSAPPPVAPAAAGPPVAPPVPPPIAPVAAAAPPVMAPPVPPPVPDVALAPPVPPPINMDLPPVPNLPPVPMIAAPPSPDPAPMMAPPIPQNVGMPPPVPQPAGGMPPLPPPLDMHQ